jgi:hypothetical protein
MLVLFFHGIKAFTLVVLQSAQLEFIGQFELQGWHILLLEFYWNVSVVLSSGKDLNLKLKDLQAISTLADELDPQR